MNTQKKKTNGNAPNDFGQMAGLFSLPTFDLETIAEMQRRNWEAVLDANRVAAEGYQTLLSRQMEIVQGTLQQASNAVQQTWQDDKKRKTTDQVEVAKAGLDQAIGNLRELVEIAQEANAAPMRIIQDRVNENLSEWRKLATR
jgi:phasin family protein